MSVLYAYICTKTTVDPFLPPRSLSIDALSRDVSDAFVALAGGRTTVGQLVFYPTQRAVPNHLLCDGREVAKASFPELYDYLGTSQGTPANADNFVLPDYIGTIAAATTAQPETAGQGSVATPPPVSPPPGEYPERTDPIYGDVDSGGRPFRQFENIP